MMLSESFNLFKYKILLIKNFAGKVLCCNQTNKIAVLDLINLANVNQLMMDP